MNGNKSFLMGIAVISISLGQLGFAEEPAPIIDTAAKAQKAAAPVPAKAKSAKPVAMKKKKVLKASPSAAKSVPVEQVVPVEKKPTQRDSVMSWLKDLKNRVSKSQARQNQIVAVAAVRGKETPDSPPLYWKGKKAQGDVDMPELKEFEEAIDNAMAGNSDDSVQKLQALVTKYPNSPLVADAQETVKKLQEPAPAP